VPTTTLSRTKFLAEHHSVARDLRGSHFGAYSHLGMCKPLRRPPLWDGTPVPSVNEGAADRIARPTQPRNRESRDAPQFDPQIYPRFWGYFRFVIGETDSGLAWNMQFTVLK
jgi:hypothetical protein